MACLPYVRYLTYLTPVAESGKTHINNLLHSANRCHQLQRLAGMKLHTHNASKLGMLSSLDRDWAAPASPIVDGGGGLVDILSEAESQETSAESTTSNLELLTLAFISSDTTASIIDSDHSSTRLHNVYSANSDFHLDKLSAATQSGSFDPPRLNNTFTQHDNSGVGGAAESTDLMTLPSPPKDVTQVDNDNPGNDLNLLDNDYEQHDDSDGEKLDRTETDHNNTHSKRRKQRLTFDTWVADASAVATDEEMQETLKTQPDEILTTRALMADQTSESIVNNPREYQLELFERAKKQNTIAVLDTGSGKTLIAVLLLKHVIEQELERRYAGHTPRISFFLVRTTSKSSNSANISLGQLRCAGVPAICSSRTQPGLQRQVSLWSHGCEYMERNAVGPNFP